MKIIEREIAPGLRTEGEVGDFILYKRNEEGIARLYFLVEVKDNGVSKLYRWLDISKVKQYDIDNICKRLEEMEPKILPVPALELIDKAELRMAGLGTFPVLNLKLPEEISDTYTAFVCWRSAKGGKVNADYCHFYGDDCTDGVFNGQAAVYVMTLKNLGPLSRTTEGEPYIYCKVERL